ncbi:MAG TPA: hypothetical protein VL463_30900 [Kofleriaceae bacterium]|nr:hypothetical protein [Kofleriaceae bacterium]
MNRTILISIFIAAIAHRATADCTIAYPMQQKKYWPQSSSFVPNAGDHRCDFGGPNNSQYDCQLSGWLITPNNTSIGYFPAVIYVDDAWRNVDRHNACEIINAMVGRGFVVFYADQRGQWDYSGGSYRFHNTGYYTWDWAAMNASTFIPADAIAADYLGDESKDLDYAISMIEGLKVGSTSTPLVDSRHVTIMGREDGAVTAIAAPAHVSHHIAATVDLGGGSRHWGSNWKYWNDTIEADAAADSAPLFVQEVENESPNHTFWAAMAAFDGAFSSDAAGLGKLALYAAFTPPSDEQTVCNNNGWDGQTCGNYWFVNDHDKVARWWPVVYDWIYRVDAN